MPESVLESLSVRGFAKRLGVDEKAVRNAVTRGRLAASVGKNAKGKAVITDVAMALQEWTSNAAKVAKQGGSSSLAKAQTGVAIERARGMKLANDQKQGRLIPADKVARAAFESARVVRDAVMNLPARLAAELAAEPDPGRVRRRLEEELRLALEAVALRLSA